MTDALTRLNTEADTCHEYVLLRLADAHEEAGNATLADGYRWLAEKQRWPARRGDRWFWRGPQRRPHEAEGPDVESATYSHGLPPPVLSAIKRRKMGLVIGRQPDEFLSAAEALAVGARFLGKWLADLERKEQSHA